MTDNWHLKPCPFCGGTAELKKLGFEKSPYGWVECMECKVETPFLKFEAAVRAWNQRVKK